MDGKRKNKKIHVVTLGDPSAEVDTAGDVVRAVPGDCLDHCYRGTTQ